MMRRPDDGPPKKPAYSNPAIPGTDASVLRGPAMVLPDGGVALTVQITAQIPFANVLADPRMTPDMMRKMLDALRDELHRRGEIE